MANYIAEPARIRRMHREFEFARVVDTDVIAARPDAQDGYQQVRESMFTNTADAQALLGELAGDLMISRGHEAAETAEPMRIGTDIDVAPVVPLARMQDGRRGLDKPMRISGISIDFQTQRNSLEAAG